MTQMIKLNGNKKTDELSKTKAKVVAALTKLKASSKPVALPELRKSLKGMDAKVIRQHVRDLVEEKVLSVKKVKEEKVAA